MSPIGDPCDNRLKDDIEMVFSLDVLRDRARARLLALRGARLGNKCRVGKGFELINPRKFECGKRLQVESSVVCKIALGYASMQLGDYVFLGKGSHFDIAGKLIVGSHVLFAPYSFIVDHNHNLDCRLRIDEQGCFVRDIVIEDDVWVGAHATVLPGVRLGRGSVVGANACVTRDVPPFAIVCGVPAVIKSYRVAHA
jgi:acetyltransferase-like isoleucine patch superfamily enzyme